jgi:hypothetical protein
VILLRSGEHHAALALLGLAERERNTSSQLSGSSSSVSPSPAR